MPENVRNQKNRELGEKIVSVMTVSGKVILRILSYVLNVLITLLLIGGTTAIIVGSVFALYMKNYVDPTFDLSMLKASTGDTTTRIYYMDYATDDDRLAGRGTAVEIEDQRLYGSENSLWADYTEIPATLIDAFVSYEDHRFWDHNGVDWWSTTGAVINMVFPLRDREYGASTITQQLIKNATGDNQVKITRKVQEIMRALYLESTMSKEDIITSYLNVVYFGNNCYGVKSAAKTYFDKDLSQLSVAECASLAAIVKNPTHNDPAYHAEKNAEQRSHVLFTMHKFGKITDSQYDAALVEELHIALTERAGDINDDTQIEVDGKINSWYTDALIDEVRDALMEKYDYSREIASNIIYGGGLQIYSVMDPEVQSVMEEIYYNDDKYFMKSYAAVQPESAMVIVNPYNGDVLGLIGGRGVKTQNRAFNRATQAKRPPGSSIKPIAVYGPALNEGVITWSSIFDDVPLQFNDISKDRSEDHTPEWDGWPNNLPDYYFGLTTVADGLTRSSNTISLGILSKLGVDVSYDYLKNKLHIDSVVDSYTNAAGQKFTDIALSPLGLGQLTNGLSVLEITSAYTIFTNKGMYYEPRMYTKVTDSEGNVILEDDQQSSVVYNNEWAATIMTRMMQNVVNFGTAMDVSLRYSVDVAGKTGTSNADFDRWFVGFTPYYVGGVWVGYDTNLNLSDFPGNPASNIWDKVMLKLHEKYINEAASGGAELKHFEDAPGVIQASFCKDSGKLTTDACALDPRGSRVGYGYFTEDTAPSEECDTHVVVWYDPTPGQSGGVVVDRDLYTGNKDALVQTALIRVDSRNFPVEVPVFDAMYVYRELPSGVKPAGWWGVPFFANMLDDGVYCGYTPGYSYPYNRFCWQYFDYKKWQEENKKTEEPSNETTVTETVTRDDDLFSGRTTE